MDTFQETGIYRLTFTNLGCIGEMHLKITKWYIELSIFIVIHS